MIRRMKIKASPNLVGGAKRGNFYGKKVVQEDSSLEQSSQIDKSRNTSNSTVHSTVTKKQESIASESKNKYVLKIVAERDESNTTEIAENMKCDPKNEIDSVPNKNSDKEINKSFVNSLGNNDKKIVVAEKSFLCLTEPETNKVDPLRDDDRFGTENVNEVSEHNGYPTKIESKFVNDENYTRNDIQRCKHYEDNQHTNTTSFQAVVQLPSPHTVPRREMTTEVKAACSNYTTSVSQFSPHVSKSDKGIEKLIAQKVHNEVSSVLQTSGNAGDLSAEDMTLKDNHLQNVVLANTTNRLSSMMQDLESLRQVCTMPDRNLKEASLKSTVQSLKSITRVFKGKIMTNSCANGNLVNKITGRRTRIKGCPVVNRRLARATQVPPEIKNNDSDLHENKVTVLENRNNNNPKVLKEQDIKSHKESYHALTTSSVDTRKSLESKENIGKTYLTNLATSKPTLKELRTNRTIHRKKHIKSLLNPVIKSEEGMKEKKVFHERKLRFRKKVSSGKLERSEMTMFDLIFWNPATNPMPGSNEEERTNKISNSINETESVTSEIIEEHKAEEEGLHMIPDEGRDENVHASESEDEGTSALAPQVKIGPNGDLIVDEKSLVIQTTAAKNRDEILSRTEVVEEPNDSSHYGKWSKKRKRSTEWTRKETARFYKALSTVGTDFSLMETVFKWRSRSELKIKFKKEERVNRHLIDTALNDCTQFDFSIFDESDYDPEEDRKEAKEAEKVEAKKRRDLEREQRKLQNEQEKKRRKEELKIERQRKKKLRSIYKKQKRKKVAKSLRPRKRSSSLGKCTPQEVICEVVFSNPVNKTIEHNCIEEVSQPTCTEEDSGMKISSLLQSCLSLDVSSVNRLSQQRFNKGSEIFPLSSLPEVVEVDSHEGILMLPQPNQVSEGCGVSSSCFSVKSSSPILSQITVPPQLICDANELAQVSSLAEDKTHNESISISTIPISINPAMYSSVYEAMETVEDEDVPDVPKLEEDCQMNWEKPSEHAQQLNKQDISQFCIPVESVQKSPSDGHQFVEINTTKGTKRIVVPPSGPETTHIVVLETADSENPSEKIYHVYTIAPVSSASERESSDCTVSTQLSNATSS